MRKSCLLCTLVILSVVNKSFAQDFSNKGKDFWVAYGYHQTMSAAGTGGTQNMVLYFAAEQDANVKVTIAGLNYSQSYFVAANTVVTSSPIPKASGQDAKLMNTSIAPENKGIHITSDKPIVAYAHIYNQSVSGASILFPTNTLGREYYSVNYANNSNTSATTPSQNGANCWFYVIAADTGTTTIEVRPSADIVAGYNNNTVLHTAGSTVTINLTQGQVYNFMGQYNGNRGVDLTGSTIRSISTNGTGCKRIAVFSGSGRINITCNGPSTAASSDNYMSQAFPKSAWGKKYLTVPASGGNSVNVYRVCVSDPATVVKINGLVTTLPLTNSFYYEIPATNAPQLIEGDKPIMVAQYFTSQNECGNSTTNMLGDPEVIYLSPVEQNINKVLWNATPNFSILEHYFNVVIPNTGTALTSFRLDGAPVPASSFFVHPQDPRYSFLLQSVGAGQHIIQSDSGFNAIAYGYGSAESYGYNAGTNIKDQYRFISVDNQFGSIDRIAAACKGAPFSLSMTFPYQPTELIWQFNGLFPDDTTYNPVPVSTTVVNGVTLYKYTLPGNRTIPATGTYPIRITAFNPTADGCNGIQEMEYDLEVFDLPKAEFNFTTNGCISNPVLFTDNSPANGGRQIVHRHWNFGDGNFVNNVTSTNHTYSAAGSYVVKYSIITDIGCKSDSTAHTVVLNNPPVAVFTPVAPFCAGKTVTFNESSTAGAGTLGKWTWDFGDGSPVVVATTGGVQTHTYANTGPYTVTLKVETTGGCVSPLTSQSVTIRPNPVVAFNLPTVCLPAGAAQFNSSSTISDGTESQFTYAWDFGDGSPVAAIQNPLHNYTATGPYNVSLTVTSNNGCVSALSQSLTTIYPEPKAIFTPPAEVCLGAAMNFTDQSNAPASSVSQWSWSFGDATTSTAQHPTKTYAAAGTYNVTLTITSAAGCQSVSPANIATHPVTVNPLPDASFNVSLPGCAGQAVTLTSTSVPNAGNLVKWTWNYGDNTSAVLTNGSPVIHTYSTVNTFPATLQVETDKGCVSAVTPKDIVINAVPEAGFVVPEICVSDNFAPFTDTSKVVPGTISAWQWNFGDVNATAGNPNTSTLQNPTHHFSFPGTYTVQLIATSNTGCKDTIPQTVNVNGAILTPVATLETTTALCSNKPIIIKDASTVDAGSILRVVIYWDDTDPNNKTEDDNPVAGKSYTHSYPEFGTPATMTYNIRYEVWSGINCVNSIQLPVTILATPQLAFGSVLPVCDNAPKFQLTQVQLVNILPGTGTFSGSGVSASGEFDPATAVTGANNITYTYTGNNGCVNSIQQTVMVNPTPDADAGPDRFLLEGGYITLAPKLVTGIPVSYTWSPATYLNNPSIPGPQASPPVDFTYTLTVTSDQGCTDSDDMNVKILKNLVIPNIFSPNGDLINDTWVIEHLESYPGCVIQIFNRYGQVVQRFVNYRPWDGKINGKDAPIGTYYYIIDPKNGRKPITGYVDIIR